MQSQPGDGVKRLFPKCPVVLIARKAEATPKEEQSSHNACHDLKHHETGVAVGGMRLVVMAERYEGCV
jgi:hypothetical protein